jgi:hypothetical protein
VFTTSASAYCEWAPVAIPAACAEAKTRVIDTTQSQAILSLAAQTIKAASTNNLNISTWAFFEIKAHCS